MDEQFILGWLGYDLLSILHSYALPHNPALSNNLKWQGGRSINMPRHQTSCWAKDAKSSIIEWSDAMLFLSVSLSGATSCCLPPHLTIDTNHPTYWPAHCRFIWCWRLRSQNLTISFLEAAGWTNASPLVHPMLKSSEPVALCLELKDSRMNHRHYIGSSGA
jgi:hypothetical protein